MKCQIDKNTTTEMKFIAIVSQAAVTADCRIVYVFPTHSGVTHDSTAYQVSGLYDVLKPEKIPSCAFVFGDDAYSNMVCVVTPFTGCSLANLQKEFNYSHLRCRITIEQKFRKLNYIF